MYLCLGWMRAVENSPTLFAIIIGLRPKTIRPTPHPQQMDLLIYFPNFSENFSSQFLITVSLFFNGSCFQGWLLRLSVTRYFNPLFKSLFTFGSFDSQSLYLTSRSHKQTKKKLCDRRPSFFLDGTC